MNRELPYLFAENLVKEYGQGTALYQALRGVSVEASAGDFVAIRGPSGCGKSTLLHLLGAMDRPTSGQVWLNRRRIDTLSLDELAQARRRSIGFIFQAYNLLPTLDVAENVALPLLLDGVNNRLAAKRSAEALHAVGMSARATSYPSQLSGGEMQRVAIARGVALEPQLVLADEPTGSLDSLHGHQILELLASLNSSRGITVLMATHSAEAAAYASRTLFLRDGQLDPQVETHASSSSV